MASFNGYMKYKFFNWEIFYSEWQKLIFGVEDYSSMEILKKRSESDKLRDKIKSLWKSFNEDRDEFKKKYAGEKKFISAYMSSFYFPNIQRSFAIVKNKQNIEQIKKAFNESGDTLNILDFGAGPLSASMGLLLALDFLEMDLCSKKINIMTVERSESMLKTGYDLMKASFGDKLNIEQSNYSSAMKLPHRADIILCANVFNEIPEKHRMVTLESIIEVLKGVLIIIEPGQDVHSRSLATLRNVLLKTTKIKLEIISPCLHTLNCPLSAQSERKDWCWFKNTWRVPDAVSFIDKITGLDHRQLNYSYLCLRKADPVRQTVSWKVISDIILPIGQNNRSRFENWMRNNVIEGNSKCLLSVSNDSVGKILLCSNEGLLTSIVGNKEFVVSVRRGDVITAIPQGTCLCKER